MKQCRKKKQNKNVRSALLFPLIRHAGRTIHTPRWVNRMQRNNLSLNSGDYITLLKYAENKDVVDGGTGVVGGQSERPGGTPDATVRNYFILRLNYVRPRPNAPAKYFAVSDLENVIIIIIEIINESMRDTKRRTDLKFVTSPLFRSPECASLRSATVSFFFISLFFFFIRSAINLAAY